MKRWAEMKRGVKILIGVVGLLIVVAVMIPLFVNANTFRPLLESELSQAMNRPVKLGSLHLSLFAGSLVADTVSIADDPAFSHTPFLSAGALHVGVEMGPLLFHRTLRVTRFAAEQPQIHLIHAANGTWNFSSLGRGAPSRTPTAKQPSSQSEPVLPGLTVGEFAIHNGQATVEDLPPQGAPLVYSNLNLTIQNFSFARQFPFSLTANLPGGGSLETHGQAGPVSEADAADTPLTADLNLKHFDPVQAGIVQKDQGFSMLGDISAHLVSDGRSLRSNGAIHADRLQLVRSGAPAPKPVDLAFTMVNALDARTGELQDVTIKTGTVAAHGAGTFRLTPQDTLVNMKLAGQSLSIDQLEALLPAVGVRLPSGSALQGGTLTTSLAITGSANAPKITGPLDVENTRLAGFNLGSKLGGLASLAGVQTGNTTEVRTFRTDLNAAEGGVQASNIYALVPMLGTVTGAGAVSPAGALAFRLNVKLNSSNGAGGTAMGVLSSLHGALGQTASVATTQGIPLVITGTTTDPHFSADVKSLGGSFLGSQNLGSASLGKKQIPQAKDLQNLNPGQVLSGLMGKKQH